MTTVALLAIIFCCLSLLMWVVYPMLNRDAVSRTGDEDELLRERLHALQTSLSEIYKSRAEDKVAEDDFRRIERRLMLGLARLNHTLGVQPEQAPEETEISQTNETTEKTETAENNRAPAKALSFCHGCGKGRTQQFKFCPYCGTDLKVA